MSTNGKNTGTILEIKGVVLDVRFTDDLPGIYNALEITRPDGTTLVAEVQQLLGDDKVRAVALDTTDGLARGTEQIATGTGEAWREMIETNVLGLLEVTRRVLPHMIEQGGGHVVVIGSIAGHKAYVGGGVYCGSKRALQPICEAIRMETLGKNIRVTSVDPGMVDTEFSVVRFRGDEEKAKKVYEGTRPLVAEDVAECVLFAADRPAHVNLDNILVMPTDQANPYYVHREA